MSAAGAEPEHGLAAAVAVRRLLGRGSIYTLGTVLEGGSLLLAVPIVTRLLSPAQFGEVATALVVAAVVALVAPLGITTAITRFHFDGEEGRDQTRALVLWAPLIALGVAIALELTGPVWAPAITGSDYNDVLRLAVWSGPPASLMLGAQAALIAQNRPGRFITVSLTSTVGAQVAAIALIVFVDADATAYMAGFVGARTLGGLVGLISVGVEPRRFRDRGLLRRALVLGLPTVSHAVGMYLLNTADRLVIGRIDGLAAVGRYQVAYLVGSLGFILLFSLTQAWAPLVYGGGEARWAVLARTAAVVYRLAALVAAALAVGAPLALLVAAPPDYDLSSLAPVSAVVAAAAIPIATYLRNVIILFQVKKTGALLWAAPLTTAVNVGLNIALVPPLGLLGGALATLGGFLLLGELLRAIGRRYAKVPWDHGEELRAWALAAPLVLLAALLPTTDAWLAVRIAAAAGLCVALAAQVRTALRLAEPGGEALVTPDDEQR